MEANVQRQISINFRQACSEDGAKSCSGFCSKNIMPTVSLANHFATRAAAALRRAAWRRTVASSASPFSFELFPSRRTNRYLIDIRCFWHSSLTVPSLLFSLDGAVNFFANTLDSFNRIFSFESISFDLQSPEYFDWNVVWNFYIIRNSARRCV